MRTGPRLEVFGLFAVHHPVNRGAALAGCCRIARLDDKILVAVVENAVVVRFHL